MATAPTQALTPLQELQARRSAYLAAELKILQSQEYQVGQGGNARRNVRAELETVRQTIKDLDMQIGRLQAGAAGTRRVYNAVPRA